MPKPNNKSLSVSKGTTRSDSVNPNYRVKKHALRSVEEYVDGIKMGDRTVLSQAITLIESSKPDYREIGEEILDNCLHMTGNSVRIGITGVPGVGKSTFIEAMGTYLTDQGEKLAVLTIDPSSTRSKGSILGDKTRMNQLSASDLAFIRPSPTSGTLGGVAQRTRETMLLCEAAGYGTIFIETVGVGQSETAVHSMTDYFLLLMLAGAGDELQGIKRGIMEMADLIAINKAEGDNLQAAKRAAREYKNALTLFPPSPSGQKTKVMTCSALNKEGIKEIWKEIESGISAVKKSGYFETRRRSQASKWMHETINRRLKESFLNNPEVAKKLPELEKKVANGEISSFSAASRLIDLFSD
ncbi:MAG: methylmalonyl Co-A mutase-associated GTPase MeaB [Balneolaceae bacterium]|nr:methylmalonyl Co-A mutase-associated GTPase MeaB [Balneolaceae bacterium]MCH8549584.1 methylmalonyl Co-A mutase-associated GTPase MeaB [Balneolaceae bacterium]